MSKHNETGIKGEQIAEKFLLEKGYLLLHRNWRFGPKEVDLVMKRGDVLVFVEVKTLSISEFGWPEDAVTRRKQGYLKAAAEAFLAQHKEFQQIQFDIVSISLENDEVKKIVHFEDAFY